MPFLHGAKFTVVHCSSNCSNGTCYSSALGEGNENTESAIAPVHLVLELAMRPAIPFPIYRSFEPLPKARASQLSSPGQHEAN